MAYALLGILAVCLLATFFVAFLSSKTWPVYQAVLVVFVFLGGLVFFYLGARTLATHKAWRVRYQQNQQQLVQAESQLLELQGGLSPEGRAVAGTVPQLRHELAVIARQRGGVFYNVTVDNVEGDVVQLTLNPAGQRTASPDAAGQALPGQEMPGQALPGQEIPQAMPGQGLDQPAPAQPDAGQPAPGEALPGQPVQPDPAQPDLGQPPADQPPAEQPVPGEAAPATEPDQPAADQPFSQRSTRGLFQPVAYQPPEQPQPVDPNTGQPIDPNTGQPVDPAAAQPVDPTTGQPIDPAATQPVDPTTGQPVDPAAAPAIDPNTGLPVDPAAAQPVPAQPDPGQPVGGQPLPGQPAAEGEPAPFVHGLVPDTIVFAFDEQPVSEGGRYLGEFKIVEAEPGSREIKIAPSLPLTEAQSQHLEAAAGGPWTLYLTMPTDNADVFAKMDDAQRQAMLPAESAAEFANADRPLRDYHQFFHEHFVQMVLLNDYVSYLEQNIQRTDEATGRVAAAAEYRQTEKGKLESDLAQFKVETEAIANYQATLEQALAQQRERAKSRYVANRSAAALLTRHQLQAVRAIDSRTRDAATTGP